MSTIIVATKHCKDFPLVVAANIDGIISDPGAPQGINKTPTIFGAKSKNGSVKCAINEASLFAAITDQGSSPGKKKTDKIVLEALKCGSLKELVSFVEDFNPAKYQPFNLVFGNKEQVYLAHSFILHSMVIKPLAVGVNVITDNIKFTGANVKAHYIHNSLNNIEGLPWIEYYAHLKLLLAKGGKVKIKYPLEQERKTGTVSSCVMAFSDSGLARYKYYNRVAERNDKEPRYNDYVDEWRKECGSPTNILDTTSEHTDTIKILSSVNMHELTDIKINAKTDHIS